MMTVEIKEVKNRAELKQFVRFPFSLYHHNKFWVPPLIKSDLETLSPGKNPAFDHCEAKYFLAWREGKIVGRIAGIINHEFIKLWGKKYARFCWFDFIDDHGVSGALLLEIESWAKSKGLEGIIGPMGFTTFERQGILVEGFDQLPTIISCYNYEYYPEHLVYHGYVKEDDYLEFEIFPPGVIPEKLFQVTEVLSKRYHLHVLRERSKKELKSYGKQVLEVINAAYLHLLGFVPLTDRQIDYTVNKYFAIIPPGYITVVLNEEGRVIGFQVAMPSLSRAFQKARGKLFPFGFIHILKAIRKPEKVDLLLAGILPEYQNKGVNAFFMLKLSGMVIKKKITLAESNGVLEENVKILNYLRDYDVRQHKRRRVYFKRITTIL